MNTLLYAKYMMQRKFLMLMQGVYYFLTSLWALLHIQSFMAVTGPKTDIWLVKVMASTIIVIALPLILQFFKKGSSSLTIVLSMAASLSFLFTDCWYVFHKVISPVYLADAAINFLILIVWLFLIFRRSPAAKGNSDDC